MLKNIAGCEPLLRFPAVTVPGQTRLHGQSDIVSGLGSVLPWTRTQILRHIPSTSRTAAVLSIIMPEEHEGQHLTTSERICSLGDSSELELFLLSNNFTFQEQCADLSLTDSARLYDERIMSTLQKSGLNDVRNFELLLRMESATAMAIAEKLFASAIRSNDFETIQAMLKAGMNPNTLIDSPVYLNPVTPLEHAASIEDHGSSIKIARLLVSYEARVNREGGDLSALCHATEAEHAEMMAFLIANGARVTPMSLECAAWTENFELIRMLLDAGGDINTKLPATSTYEDGRTTLGIAIQQENPGLVHDLLEEGADTNIPQPSLYSYFYHRPLREETTALGLAAEMGNLEILELLLEARANVNIDPGLYFCPLRLAVERGHTDVIERLLHAGADVRSADVNGERTLLQPATFHGDARMCRILLERGATVEVPTSGNRRFPPLLSAILSNSVETVSMLLSYKTSVDAVYYQRTAIGEAVATGNIQLIEMLLQAGASKVGKDIRRIGNMEAAGYLERRKMLQDIVSNNGRRLLAAAISEEKEDLVNCLLRYNADRTVSLPVCSTEISSPLEAAISTGDMQLAILLIKRGAWITRNELSAGVWEALGTGNDAIIRTLIAYAGPRYGFSFCSTTVNMAVQQRNHSLVQFLLDAGVDPKGRPNTPEYLDLESFRKQAGWWRSDTLPNHIESVLETAARLGDSSMLQILLEATDWEPRHTGQALTIAIESKHNHLVQGLLDAGADPNSILYSYGTSTTPLDAAVAKQCIPLVQTLLERGANIDLLGGGFFSRTPLQKAVEIGNVELVDMLLEAGANVNGPIAVKGGATALQIAAITGYLGIARKLLNAGANVNAKASYRDGRTALEGAAENGRIDMLYMLLGEGAAIEGRARRHYVRAIKLADINGHGAAAKLLRSWSDWTELDSRQYDEEFVGTEESEYDTDEQMDEMDEITTDAE